MKDEPERIDPELRVFNPDKEQPEKAATNTETEHEKSTSEEIDFY
ncbi:hypothetical protein [Fictibacillus sp. S7]|nr:hypothetical protein [Fictibacillus sp. S7]